jgi:hypothetical protein
MDQRRALLMLFVLSSSDAVNSRLSRNTDSRYVNNLYFLQSFISYFIAQAPSAGLAIAKVDMRSPYGSFGNQNSID